MRRKSTASDEKERGSSSCLEAVRSFLQNDTIPESYSRNNKRALRRRAKQFVLINGDLYFTCRCKRSRQNSSLLEEVEDEEETAEKDSDDTQVLRKVLFSDEEQQKVVNEAHIGEDSTHFGVRQTTERVSVDYYWVGIINTVRSILHYCDVCVARGNRCNASTLCNPNISHVRTLNNPVITISNREQNGVKSEDEIPQDLFFATQETSNFFWQRVEVQVFGPYTSGRKQVYVAVALDCYSQFPEAMIIENISSASLTTFVLNLICRYGVMEKLCTMQNKCTQDVYFCINMQNLEGAGITLTYLSKQTNNEDERWQRVIKTLDNFIEAYPKMWDQCLEAFMMPLRISLPPQADYAPAYLTYNREPMLPEKLSHKSSSSFAELRLTEDEEKETMDLLMTAYGQHNKLPATTHIQQIRVGPDLLPTVKLEVMPTLPDRNVMNLGESTIVPHSFNEKELQQQLETRTRIGQKRKDEKLLVRDIMNGRTSDDDVGGCGGGDDDFNDVDEEEDRALPDSSLLNLEESTFVPVSFDEKERQEQLEMRTRRRKKRRDKTRLSNTVYAGTADDDDEGDVEFSDSEKEDNDDKTYTPYHSSTSLRKDSSGIMAHSSIQKRKPVFSSNVKFQAKREKWSALSRSPQVAQLVKQNREQPPKPATDMDQDSKEDPAQTPKSTTKETRSVLTSSGLMNSLELMDLDLYYMVIKSFKERSAYPPRVSVYFKRAVRRLAETLILKKGKLYGNVGRASGRLIIMRERERFCLLRKAHARGEEHQGRVRVLKTLLDMNVFWKGISLEVDAFIHACPECVTNNPLRNKTVIRIPSLSKEVTQKDHEGDMHLSEDEEEECTYEDFLQYLMDGTFPSTTTADQQTCIKERSSKFCLVEGSLYYKPTPTTADANLRQVLFSDRTKQKAIQEAHIEDENHLSQQDTQIRLRRRYFWSGMTYDVMQHVMACCMAEHLAAVPMEHHNPIIQQRVEKFRRYYKEGVPENLGIPETSNGTVADSTEETTVMLVPKEDKAEIEKAAQEGENSETMEQSAGNTVTAASSTDSGVLDSSHPVAAKPQAGATDSRTVKEDRIIEQAMEAIIVKVGGEKSENRKKLAKLPKPKPPPAPAIAKSLSQLTSRHKCDHCGRIVNGETAFKIHLYKHTGIKPFNCTVCGRTFTSLRSQRIHMRKHTGIRPYLCNLCGRDFFRSGSLRYHLKAHAAGRGTPVKCDICGRKFSFQHLLNRHKEFKHPAQTKVFMCNQCGKYFNAARRLKRHEKSHTGVTKYQCQYCSKVFLRKEYLNSHLNTHSEYDPQLEKLKLHNKKLSGSKKPLEQDCISQHHPTETVTMMIPGPPGGDSASSSGNVIQWAESERHQSHHCLEERRTVTNMDTYHTSSSLSTSTPSSSSHILNQSHLPHPSSIHHVLHHPVTAHTTRVMNVPGPHRPVSVTVSATDTSHGEIMLQHSAECLPGEASSLTEADLNAFHLLAHAGMSGQNWHSM